LPLACAACERLDAPAKLSLAPRISQLHARKPLATRIEVDVSVVEARQSQLAPEVHNPGLRPRVPADLSCAADGDNPAVQASHSLRMGLCGISRPDLPIDQNEIGKGLRCRRRGRNYHHQQ
jgi:hypothetical protein